MFGQAIGNPAFDWNFYTIPQPGLKNLPLLYPRGKMLGGSSGLNFMAWDRASVREYDAWEKVRSRTGGSVRSVVKRIGCDSSVRRGGIGRPCFLISRRRRLCRLRHLRSYSLVRKRSRSPSSMPTMVAPGRFRCVFVPFCIRSPPMTSPIGIVQCFLFQHNGALCRDRECPRHPDQ